MNSGVARTLVHDPKLIREQVLHPDRLLNVAAENGGDVVAGITAGVGKTTAYKKLVRSLKWQRHGFHQVHIIVPTRRVLKEVCRKLGRSLSVEIYPSIDDPLDALCAPDNVELKGLFKRGLSFFATVSICQRCKKRRRCRFFSRHQYRRFQQADVVLACEASLQHEPDFFTRLRRQEAFDRKGRQVPVRILTINDEAVGVRSGFVATISEAQIARERELAWSIGAEDVYDALDHLIQHPQTRWREFIPTLGNLTFRWQRRGMQLWKDYEYQLPLALAYLASPLWWEDGIFAVARYPVLPQPTLFFGASLDSDLLRWRYGRKLVTDILPGVVVRHQQTRTVVIRTSAFTPTNWMGNSSTIAAFLADLLIREAALGRTVCLLTRKDLPKEPWASRTVRAIRGALLDRKATHIRLLNPSEELPKKPIVGVVPIITVGSIGVNDYEHYSTIAQAMAYHVPVERIQEMAFGDRPPSERPAFDLDARRRPVWADEPTPEDRKRVEMAIRLMEIDPLVQGASRVRGSIRARLLVLCTQHDVSPWLGTPEVVRMISDARLTLSLGSAIGNRQEQQITALQALYAQGGTLSAIAKHLDLSYATIRRLAERCALPVRRGRPARIALTTTNHSII